MKSIISVKSKIAFFVVIFLLLLTVDGCARKQDDNNTSQESKASNYSEKNSQNTKQKSNIENLNELKRKGLKVIEDQSFPVDLENWGKVRFVSSEFPIGGTSKLRFYLADSKDNILYTFPDFYGNQWSTFYEFKAVSFNDVNNDGFKDIVIIADFATGVGENGATPFHVGEIYFQKNKEFISLYDLDKQINSTNNNANIDMILKFSKGKVSKELKLIENDLINTTKSLSYKNRKYGFMLNFPPSWDGKYIIDEKEGGISVLQKYGDKTAMIFELSTEQETNWIEWTKTPEDENSLPVKKINSRNGLVFVYYANEQPPYMDLDEEEKKATAEYNKMCKDIKSIISSFQFIK